MERASTAFGALLRDARRRVGIGQRELAVRAGVSERTVRNIESGRVEQPHGDSMRRIAEVVGLETPPVGGSAPLRIGILGPLLVSADHGPVDIGPAKQRCLLGLLALRPGVVVRNDEIVGALWEGRPPASCLNLVHTYASRLRRALDAAQPEAPTVQMSSTRGGYVLKADPEALDLLRFEDLAERARRLGSVELYEEALDCWRGTVLVDLPGSIRQHPVAVAVTARRVTTAMAYADLVGETGGHSRAVDRLAQLADEQPLHEAVQARLMLALAGSGQQAAALRLFDDVRRRLDDELGVEPGQELRDAHLRVLRHEFAAPVVVHRPKPAELPPDVGRFVGRGGELEVLDRAMRAGSASLAITSIDGMPGIGKTALAVHWAHRVKDQFPDGQLYVNLRGYDRGEPVHPQHVMVRFLRSLGVAADQVPVDEDEAVSLYRSTLAGKRVLVLLDNANSVEQVQSLLPGTPSCLVVVTSRDRLPGLAAAHGAYRLSLDTLAGDEAHALMVELLGAERVAAEPDAITDLVRGCGFLPLALRVTGANLSMLPYTSVAEYAEELRGRGRLDGDGVRAAFDLSCERLSPASRTVFGLLGLVPGSDCTTDVAASMARKTVLEARAALRELVSASLVQEHAAGRYRMHDLLKEYAAGLVEDSEVRTAAVTRLYDFYLALANAATKVLYPNEFRMFNALPRSGVTVNDDDTALSWLDVERANLLSAISFAAGAGTPAHGWLLVDALRGYLLARGYNAEGVAACRAALVAAQAQGDRRAEASMQDMLGLLNYNLSAYAEAEEAHTASLALARAICDRAAEANSLHNLGRVFMQLGIPVEAASSYARAMAIRSELGDVAGEISSLIFLGVAEMSQANLDAAVDHSQRGLGLARSTGDREMEARALHIKATIIWARGDLETAIRLHTECLDAARDHGNRHLKLATLVYLAEAHCDLGWYDRAEACALDGLTLERSIGERRQRAGCLEMLAVAYDHTGRREAAETHFREALRLSREINFGYGQASVLIGMSRMYRTSARLDDARTTAELALKLMRESGRLLLECRAETELALAMADNGQLTKAGEHAEWAVRMARIRRQRLAEARALDALGDIRRQAGDAESGREHKSAASVIFGEIGCQFG